MTSLGWTSHVEQIWSSGPGSGLQGRNSLLSAGENVICSNDSYYKRYKAKLYRILILQKQKIMTKTPSQEVWILKIENQQIIKANLEQMQKPITA